VVLKLERKPLSSTGEELTNYILTVRSEIKIKFGYWGFAADHFNDYGRLVEKYPQINAFCCSDDERLKTT